MASRSPSRLGPAVTSAAPATRPSKDITLLGKHVTIIGLLRSHAHSLFPQISGTANDHLWDYMGDGPFASPDKFAANMLTKSQSQDPVFYSIISNTETDQAAGSSSPKVVGHASLMRIDPPNHCIEVGNIMFSPSLQRTPAATEAMYLLAKYAFEDLGYRRYEWKCNSLNAPSRRAAERLGFVYEGTFRQHMIVKGRSRDTTWFSMLAEEWNRGRKGELEEWLNEETFVGGKQKRRLEEFRK